MNTLDKVTQSAIDSFSKLPENANKAFDPAWVSVFANIIQELVAAFQKCKASPNGATSTANNPGIISRIVLRNQVRNSLGHTGFREHGSAVISSLLDTGKHLTAKDFESLYNDN